MSPVTARSVAAYRFVTGSMTAPGTYGDARLMPTHIKTGRAASIFRGFVHLSDEAALAVNDTGAQLAARWVCGGGSPDARPAGSDEEPCEACVYLAYLPTRGPVVYRCFAANSDLVYIGSSTNVRGRVRSHRTGTEWWSEVARVETESHPSIEAARLAEATAIRTEGPLHNLHNNLGRMTGARS